MYMYMCTPLMASQFEDHLFHEPTVLAEPLQDGNTPLHLAAMGGHATCVERLICTLGIDVKINDLVSSTVC